MKLIEKKYSLIFIISLFLFCSAYAKDNSIALLYSKYSQKLSTHSPNWVMNHLTAWELFLMNNKIKYHVIKDGDLESGIEGDFQTLIIPASKYLSDKEINSIKEFVNAGGSVLLTWQSGIYNEKGTYRGWQDLKSLFNINDISEIESGKTLISGIIKSGNPVSANLPPGCNISFQTNNKPVQFKYGVNINSPVMNASDNTSSIIYGNAGKGKFIWFGFDILSVTGSKAQLKNFNDMIINSLNWLDNSPVLWINTWPKNKNNAVVIGYDVNFTGDNLQNFIRILKDENVKAQFFIPLNLANIDTISYLKKYGDFTFIENNNYEWRNLSSKVEDLQSLKSGVEEITGVNTSSFRLPSPAINNENFKALSDAGFTSLNCSIYQNNYLPWFDQKNKNLLIIPNTGLDEYAFKKNFKIKNADELAEKYYDGYSKIAEIGGLYVFNYHDAFKCMPDKLNAIKVFIQKLNDHAWVTTFNELHNWWELKSKLSAEVSKSENEKNTYDITLKNNSSAAGNNIELTFFLGSLKDNSAIKVLEGTKEINFSFDPKSNKVSVYIDNIPANETKHLTIEIGNFS